MDKATQERLKDLRKQSREINKQIKATQSTAKMDKALADRKSLQELKDKLEQQVQSHPLCSNKSLKWLMKQPDYYTYALWTQSYTYKANSKDAGWVQEELNKGTKESTLIDNANKMRIKAWQRQETARRRPSHYNHEVLADRL